MEPEDVENKEFLVVLRGYDKDQVRAFLTEVAAAFRKLSAAGEQQSTVAGEPSPADVASMVRSLVDEAVNIRLDAEREAAEIRAAAAHDNPAARIRNAVAGLRGSPPGR